jgi:hypothetical protein
VRETEATHATIASLREQASVLEQRRAEAGAAVPEVVVAQPAVTSAAVDRHSAAATADSPGVIGK